jgi:ABC-2 type transport system permease protein
MKFFAPASWPWLLRNELRLSWRAMGGKSIWFIVIAGGLLWSAFHFAAWAMLKSGKVVDDAAMQTHGLVLAGGAFWFMVSIMVSQTMALAVAALFERGDLDLLLTSPLSQRAIFATRGIAIGLAACLMPVVFILPFAHVGLLTGKSGMLAIYPVIISVALGCAALGMLLTMSLVRWLGARRAKTAAQIAAAFIGAGFFLLTQLTNWLSKTQQANITSWLKAQLADDGWLAHSSLLWLPARAMSGELLPLSLVMLSGIGGFWLVVNLTYRRFVSGTQESVTGGKMQLRKSAAIPPFRSGLIKTVLRKEWKLIARDPQLISQTLLQLLYMLPLLFVGFRSDGARWLLIPGLVILVASLASNLAWITIAAEDAPDLIGSAPVAQQRVMWIKAAAAVMPVLMLLLPLSLWWILQDPWSALVLLLCATGAMFSAALIQIWNPGRGKRNDLKARYQKMKLSSLIELFSSFGWAGAAACMNADWSLLPVALLFALAGPATAWIIGRNARFSVYS